VIAYWEGRAGASRHPIIRMRYADLVWEFGRRAKGPVSAALPRVVIDATLTAATSGLFKDTHSGRTRLVRALELALALREAERVIAVRDALVAYERRVADDSLPGTWGFSFDELLENRRKQVPMPDELVGDLVADLEARLARLTGLGATEALRDP